MGSTGLIRSILLLLFSFLSVATVAAQSQNVAAPSTDGSYPDSADGLGTQVCGKTHVGLRQGTLGLPVPHILGRGEFCEIQ